MVIHHRSLYTDPRARQGHPFVDPASVTDFDVIEYDNGKRVPSFAQSTYGRQRPHGPFRPLTDFQARVFRGRILLDVNKNGVAALAQPIMHYPDRVAWVAPDHVIVEDAYTEAAGRSFYDLPA